MASGKVYSVCRLTPVVLVWVVAGWRSNGPDTSVYVGARITGMPQQD